jgi:hypothetical protein
MVYVWVRNLARVYSVARLSRGGGGARAFGSDVARMVINPLSAKGVDTTDASRTFTLTFDEDGDCFFFCAATGESVWEAPVGARIVDSEGNSIPAEAVAATAAATRAAADAAARAASAAAAAVVAAKEAIEAATKAEAEAVEKAEQKWQEEEQAAQAAAAAAFLLEATARHERLGAARQAGGAKLGNGMQHVAAL